MKKQTAEDVKNIPVWPINVLVLHISVECNNVYSVRNHKSQNLVISPHPLLPTATPLQAKTFNFPKIK